jgi:hypothetical protein
MSTKFEQLLDLIVNEEMDKANELFHEIVVEKSRDIYENLIAEEADDEEMDESADEEMDEAADEEEMDESADSDDEEMEESVDEEADESVDLEDSYSMEADDEEDTMGGDAADEFGAEVGADDDMGGEGGSEESAIFDIKNAIAELEAAFADLEAAQGGDMGGDEFDDKEDGMDDMGDEPMKMGFQEGRRMTREYTETVGTNWDKGATMKAQGQYVGAGSGDKESAPVEGRSPISSGSGKPTSGANAKNLAQSHTEGGTDKGTSPGKVNKGINPESSEKFAAGIHNVEGKKSGVKTLSNVKGGHGAEKKGAGPGPVGSGTGDKAGQTSVAKIPQFLKKL